jgi:UDP-N-acetylmuramate--alanine ligase
MKHEKAEYFVRDPDSSEKIRKRLQSGDVFITLGAGDGWKLGLDVLNKI